VHARTKVSHHFTEQDVQLLQKVADRIALAIDRAQLYESERAARVAEQQARQEAEDALARARLSEMRFQRLMDTGIVGIVIGDSSHVIEANDAYLKMLGYTRADLREGKLSQNELMRPEQQAETKAMVEQALLTGVSVLQEKEYVHRDGSRVPVLVGIVLLERDPVRFVSIVLDLTERDRLEGEREEALRRSEEQFRSMADTAPVLLWVAGTDTLVSFVNVPWLQFTGRKLEQELGNGWAERVHPEDFQRCLDSYLTAFEARQSFTIEYRLQRFDGEYRWLLDTGVPRYASDGSFQGYIGSAIDVTEREQLKREREEAQAREWAANEVARQMDEFFALAAHDIRSPVTAVRGNVQLAQRRADHMKDALQAASAVADGIVADPVIASLNTALGSVDRLVRLTDLLFDTAQARTGKLQMHFARSDIAALVRDQVAAHRAAAPERTISLEAPDDPVPVQGDADRISQVLANYVTNALKYSPGDQPIDVLVKREGVMALVSVRDRGPGLPPEEQDHVWELFHRAPGVEPQGGTGSVGSMGLGLYISKRLVELHRGKVGVVSEAGQGATFWFTLPLMGSDPPADSWVEL
jgi:PAS domain S-box-containing protein